MTGFIDTVERDLLDYFFATYMGGRYLALSTTTPTETGTNFTEPVGNGYGRLATAVGDWAAAAGGGPSTKANANILQMPVASGAWGTCTHWGLFVAGAGGTVQFWAPLTASISPILNDVVTFGVGALIAKLGDPTDTY